MAGPSSTQIDFRPTVDTVDVINEPWQAPPFKSQTGLCWDNVAAEEARIWFWLEINFNIVVLRHHVTYSFTSVTLIGIILSQKTQKQLENNALLFPIKKEKKWDVAHLQHFQMLLKQTNILTNYVHSRCKSRFLFSITAVLHSERFGKKVPCFKRLSLLKNGSMRINRANWLSSRGQGRN